MSLLTLCFVLCVFSPKQHPNKPKHIFAGNIETKIARKSSFLRNLVLHPAHTRQTRYKQMDLGLHHLLSIVGDRGSSVQRLASCCQLLRCMSCQLPSCLRSMLKCDARDMDAVSAALYRAMWKKCVAWKSETSYELHFWSDDTVSGCICCSAHDMLFFILVASRRALPAPPWYNGQETGVW